LSYLIDTDWVADYLVDRPVAVQLLENLAVEGLAIAIPTYGEIYEGLIYGRDREAREAGFARFFEAVDLLSLTEATMRRFAAIRGQLRREGNLIGDMDLLIASTAIENELTLVTRNRRHFDRVPDLELYQES
jgi:tRNA(fMet)-specific endonuclease VapC